MRPPLKILPLILAVIAPSFSYGKTLEFLYDASGNRITRQIVINTRSVSEDNDSGQRDANEMFQDLVAQKTIRIHPNPTKGVLKVEIAGYVDGDYGSLALFNMSGQLMLTADVDAETTALNLSNLPNGIYILRISLDGEDTVCRIIKD